MKKAILTTIAIAVATASLSANAGFMFRSELPGVKASVDSEVPESDPVKENPDAWSEFAIANEIPDPKDLNYRSFTWDRTNLSNLPEELYPVAKVNRMFISGNSFSSIASLSSITEAYELDLSHNNITSLYGLNNLDSVYELYLNGNPALTDISALSNLKSADYVDLDSDIASRTGFVPISSESWLCQSKNAGVIQGPSQADICY
jgi:hypothetical protein